MNSLLIALGAFAWVIFMLALFESFLAESPSALTFWHSSLSLIVVVYFVCALRLAREIIRSK